MNQNYFNRVYEKTYRKLLRYAIVHLSDPIDAEDALQNVYIAFYRRIERYGSLDILMPQAFLMKMLRHEIVQNYAERKAHAAYSIEDYEDAIELQAPPFEDMVFTRAAADEVFEAAKRLPSETYRVFVLYYGYEMRVSEIADELSIGTETVKSRLYRARCLIRSQLKSSEERRQV